MSSPAAEAVGKMLLGFGARLDPVRVDAFLEALEDATVCMDCGAVAAKRLTGRQKRTPVPFDLVDEAREIQASIVHQDHMSDRAELGPGDTHIWWVTEAPAHIRKCWPELDGQQAIAVARRMEQFDYVSPSAEAIALELDDRKWWLGMYPDLSEPVTVPPDPRLPKGDR